MKNKIGDLKIRIISGAIALLIVVPLIILGGIAFEVGICIIATLAFKELIDLKKSHEPYPSTMVFIGLLCMLSLVLSNNIDASIYKGITYQLFALIALLLIIPVIFYKEDVYTSKDAFYLLGITLFLGLIFNLFTIIRMRSLALFIFLIIVPMFNDIFAYLIGSKIGKHKMCTSISPKKSWEGSAGGLIVGSICGLIIYHFFVGSITFKIVLMTLILSASGQLGDLVMSRIKRENGIKDFSNIMPGHGGILDRIDSTIFVFLAYIFLMII